MKNILLFALLFLGSCTPKPDTIKVISSYQYGLETTESTDLMHNLTQIGKFCLKNNAESNEEQLLIPIRKYKAYTHYKYELSEVVSWFNNLNNCENNSPIIYIDNISSSTKNYQRFSINQYRAFITLNTSYLCNQETKEYSSQAKQELANNEFLYGKKKNHAIMSATIILAFHAAVADVYNQIKSQCEI